MDRRDFMRSSLAAAGLMWMGSFREAYALGTRHPEAGKPWDGWNEGELQVHFIYTGVAESMFYIFPDGTTMLLDCGDHDAIGRGALAVHALPSCNRHAGEWIARYVERVNPHKTDVDYMMLSHYHNDHGGGQTFYADKEVHDGKDYFISGFSQAAKTLHFGKAFDRCWPDYKDPIPLLDDGAKMRSHMESFYNYMHSQGMEIEQFEVGKKNQIKLLHAPEKYKNFSIFNLCGNGRIASRNGKIKDLYAERIKKENPKTLNENGLSLGMIMTYGNFKYYTAGDFSDKWKLEDGSTFEIEDALAEVCEQVNVAKINHHGHYSMPEKLVAALRSQVYISCVWDQLHNVDPVMARLADKNIYPGGRIVCPGILPAERRIEAAGKPWLGIVPEASYEGSHIILTVQPNTEDYSITYLDARDEQMKIKSVIELKA